MKHLAFYGLALSCHSTTGKLQQANPGSTLTSLFPQRKNRFATEAFPHGNSKNLTCMNQLPGKVLPGSRGIPSATYRAQTLLLCLFDGARPSPEKKERDQKLP